MTFSIRTFCLTALLSGSVFASGELPQWGTLHPAATEPTQEGTVSFANDGEPQMADEGIMRRDPSDIIKVDGTYHVWYTKIIKGTPGFPDGWGGTVWHATSPDGHTWTEQGQALGKSPNVDDWDSNGVYTPNITIYKGKYLLAYTAQTASETKHRNRRAEIGIAVSDSPDGPWQRLPHNPVIPAGEALDSPDGFLCDDTVFIVRGDQLFLYYKGWPRMEDTAGKPLRYLVPKGAPGKRGGQTFLLGAVSSDPLNQPFVKFEKGPLHRAHEMVLWPEEGGATGSFCMGWGELLYYRAKDGKHFAPITPIASRQGAAGVYRADFGPDWDGSRPSWGLKMANGGLRRFTIDWPGE